MQLSNKSRWDEAKDNSNKAVEYAKKSGDNNLYAGQLFWNSIYNDISQGLEKFKEIVSLKEDLFNRDGIATYAMSNGFSKLLSALKNAEVDIKDENVEYESVCPGVKYENGKVLLWGEPGQSRTRGRWEGGTVIGDVFVHADIGDNIILSNDFKTGYKIEGEGFSYSMMVHEIQTKKGENQRW